MTGAKAIPKASQKIIPYSEYSRKVESEGVKMDWWPDGKLRSYDDKREYYMFREDGSPLQFYREGEVREDDILIIWADGKVEEHVNATEERAEAIRQYMDMLQNFYTIHPQAIKAEEAERVMERLERLGAAPE